MKSSKTPTEVGDEIEITFEEHCVEGDFNSVDLMPPKVPIQQHTRNSSRGKSGSSLEEFAAGHHDAFDGDLNPFEILPEDDAASVGYDGYKPLPIPDQLGHAQIPPSALNLPPLPAKINAVTAILPIPDDEEAALPMPDQFSERIVDFSNLEGDPTPADASAIGKNSSGGPYSSSNEAPRSVISAGMEAFKYLYSLVLLIFCVVLVMGAIFTQQTTSTASGFSTVGTFFIFWFLILWLAMMEGGQGALVGLQPIDPNLYKESHPLAYKISSVVHKGENLGRFIVGRQFLVVLVVFVSQLMSSATPDIELWGISKQVTEIFLNSGVALMVTTIVLGQLTAQLNAANCMLDFVNNFFVLYMVTYLSLVIEFSGLLHSVYLVQLVFSKISGQATESNEPPRNACQRIFFWIRVIFSLTVLGFAFAVTLSALFQGQTTMWQGVPESVSVILFFLLMCFVGMMEGMQIALFAVLNIPSDDLERQSTVAYKNCQLTFRGENLQAVLVGRQICVTICTFVIARITTLDVEVGVDDNIFGVSDGMQRFFNTGLLGAVITTIVSSLAWRVIASSFPISFLSNPLVNIILRLCLLLEATGVCSSSWVLARYHKALVKYQPDEVYLEGTQPHTGEPVSTRDKDIDRFVNVVRYSYSLALLLFCIILVVTCIFTEQTKATVYIDIHPAIGFVVFWVSIIWLAMMEGAQGCLIGLRCVPEESFAESHPLTLRNTSIVYRSNNMQSFIIGRQFLVLTVVFIANWITVPISDASVLGLPKVVNDLFLTSGLAVILITIILGQLTSQVNAATCMLDFINNSFTLYFVTYLSLLVEWSGLLHGVYVFKFLFAKITRNSVEPNQTRRCVHKIFFWARVGFSICLLAYSSAVTLVGLMGNKSVVWTGLSKTATVILFVVLMCVVGMMEGVQIALFAVATLSEDELKSHRVAYANYELTCAGQNLQAFLVGRQICVTAFFFVVAMATTWTVEIGMGEKNIFGVSDNVQQFFNTGLLAAFVTTVLASLVWRVVASSFPLSFMSNPLIYLIIRLCLIVEASGICSACWVFGRWNKLLVRYQPDGVYLDGAEKQGREPVTRRDKDVDVTITVIKYICSTALLGFGVAVTMSLIFTEQTKLASNSHPAVAFIVIWFLLVWLAMMEGGQGCLVGLQGVDPELYMTSHRITLKNVKIAHKGNNMQRFIIGRQFLVVLVVFITNLCGSPLPGSQVFGLPETVAAIFVDSGVSLILMTVILGQLTAQINAASCMLDFINNYFMLYFVTHVSMIIEASGILHCVFLVQILFSRLTGTTVETNEPAPSWTQQAFFWGRATYSLALLSFALAVTLAALFEGRTTSWENLPNGVSVVLFFALMLIAGLMEGMQIALFAVVNLPETELTRHQIAKATCQLTFQGKNLQAFLIGRQICVTVCTFIIAKITTLDVEVGVGENIFGVSDGIQTFFNTGLLGAIITTVIGSLAWRIIGASFPVAFLSNPLVYVILRLCLVIEASGVCSAAWLLALINKQIVGFQEDTVYIGSPQERAPSAIAADDLVMAEENIERGAGDTEAFEVEIEG